MGRRTGQMDDLACEESWTWFVAKHQQVLVKGNKIANNITSIWWILWLCRCLGAIAIQMRFMRYKLNQILYVYATRLFDVRVVLLCSAIRKFSFTTDVCNINFKKNFYLFLSFTESTPDNYLFMPNTHPWGILNYNAEEWKEEIPRM